MHIAVFCGSSLPRNKEIVEAADDIIHSQRVTELVRVSGENE